MSTQRRKIVWAWILAMFTVGALCAYADGAKPVKSDRLMPLHPRSVKVGGEIGRRVQVTINNNLLQINVDKDFLAPFRARTTTSGYIGLGKLIDATVRFAAYTQDEKVLALKNHLVDEVIKLQEPDGYVGMFTPEDRMWGMWDVHEMGYIVYGLLSDYRFFNQQRSLAAARKAADYIVQRWSTKPADWDEKSMVATHVSVTGLERTLLTLTAASGDPRYLDFCLRQRALADWDLGIVIGRRELIEGHIYAYVARCLAQAETYRLVPEEKLLQQSRRAIDFLTAHDGMTITGGAGQSENWTTDQDGRGELGETCATAYQVRLYESLLRLNGESYYGDLMERTIYNALFAAQSPDGRKIRYYAPFEGPRVYFPMDTYCCPCNYRRIIAELPTMVYYACDGGVAINLYTASEASLPLAGDVVLRVRQQTDYPSSGRVLVHVAPSRPAEFPLRLRIPRWCPKADVTVNGQKIEAAAVPGSFLTIQRAWKPGDQVLLDMPMECRLVLGRQRQAGAVAVMRGPLVYCLNPQGLPPRDAADLGRMVVDPCSLAGPQPSASVRPDGTACELKARNPGTALGKKAFFPLKLTEFPDPDGTCVYFRLNDYHNAVPDELLRARD